MITDRCKGFVILYPCFILLSIVSEMKIFVSISHIVAIEMVFEHHRVKHSILFFIVFDCIIFWVSLKNRCHSRKHGDHRSEIQRSK